MNFRQLSNKVVSTSCFFFSFFSSSIFILQKYSSKAIIQASKRSLAFSFSQLLQPFYHKMMLEIIMKKHTYPSS